MLDLLKSRIPDVEPDLQIGPLSMWVFGYTNGDQKDAGDLAYRNTPILLETEEIIVLSRVSDTALFNFRKFLDGLILMYNTINVMQSAELSSDNSEFNLTLVNNDSGQVKIDITYHAWAHTGTFSFERKIDQSYLPPIIEDLKKIIANF